MYALQPVELLTVPLWRVVPPSIFSAVLIPVAPDVALPLP